MKMKFVLPTFQVAVFMGMLTGLLTSMPAPASAQVISDGLVTDLSCPVLTKENVLKFIAPEKMAKRIQSLGTIHSNFDVDGMKGHCWGIAKAQRLALYLINTPESERNFNEAPAAGLRRLRTLRESFLNMVRGSVPAGPCYDRSQSCDQRHEAPYGLQMLELASPGEFSDLIKYSRASMPVDTDTITIAETDGTSWLNRSRSSIPALASLIENDRLAMEELRRRIYQLDRELQNAKIDIMIRTNRKDISASDAKRETSKVEKAHRNAVSAIEAVFPKTGGESDSRPRELSEPTFSPLSGTRSLTDDLVRVQKWKFMNASNLGFLFGSRERSKAENQAVFERIKSELANGRMPLLNIRFSRTRQHILLVYRADVNATNEFVFHTFDSNEPFPTKEVSRIENGVEKKWYEPTGASPQPQVLRFSNGQFYFDSTREQVNTGYDPVGVFEVDSSEMDDIQSAVFNYYRAACGR